MGLKVRLLTVIEIVTNVITGFSVDQLNGVKGIIQNKENNLVTCATIRPQVSINGKGVSFALILAFRKIAAKVGVFNMSEDQSEIREAKRVAAIAESLSIIRTLNSRRLWFTVTFTEKTITFEIDNVEWNGFENIIPKCTGHIEPFNTFKGVSILFTW